MSLWQQWNPVILMLVVDVNYAVINSMIKKVIDEGMDRLVLLTLRMLVATLLMAPIAYLSEWQSRTKLTLSISIHIFFGAMIGAAVTQYLFYVGLLYTSATFACAFLNITPILTFLLALVLRFEHLNLKSCSGLLKSLGTLVCLAGVLVLMLYKGVVLTNNFTASDKLVVDATKYSSKNWWLGSLALVGGSVCWSSWFIIQSKIGNKYPARYSCGALTFFFGFLQSMALTLVTERGFSLCFLQNKLQIATVLFSGIVGSALGFLAMSWCVDKRGPVFTAAFTPLVQIIVAGIDFSILHEQIYLGSVLGSVLIVVGLYFLLWGKNKESQISAVKSIEANAGQNSIQAETV